MSYSNELGCDLMAEPVGKPAKARADLRNPTDMDKARTALFWKSIELIEFIEFLRVFLIPIKNY